MSYYSIDTNFGLSGGIISGKFNTGACVIEVMGVQSTGKIIVVGEDTSYCLARYNPNGVLDTTFGTNGVVRADFSGNSTNSVIFAMAIQSNDYIIIGGLTENWLYYTLARYTKDGVLDTSFGVNGKIVSKYASNSNTNTVKKIYIQSDGKIIVTGRCITTVKCRAIARFTTTGILDPSFGTGGIMIDPSGYNSYYAENSTIQSNGSIVIAGFTYSSDIRLFRYTSTGAIDTTFGTSGVTAPFYFKGSDTSLDVHIQCQSNGSIIVIGDTKDTGLFGLARFKPNGTIDASFGSNGTGIIYADFSSIYPNNSFASSGTVLPDDSILVVGTVASTGAIAKFTPNGSFDTTFAPNGVISNASLPSSTSLIWNCIAMNSNQILVGGKDSTNGNYILARYLPPYPCFKSGTKILTIRGYIEVDNLRKGDLVKTRFSGFVPIKMIGSRVITHNAKKSSRSPSQLYMYSTHIIPELFENLVLTGCHSVLVEEYTNDSEKQRAIDVNGDTYITDDLYRLPACVDKRALVYNTPGSYTIYHFALDHEDPYMNYGVYANGLLVESCSIYNMNARLVTN
jgi:uncharacterized delta-60 repeat protein